MINSSRLLSSQNSIDRLQQHEEHEEDANDGVRMGGLLTSPLRYSKDHDESSYCKNSCCDLFREEIESHYGKQEGCMTWL